MRSATLRVGGVALTAFAVGSSHIAVAQSMYRCTGADGKTAYQDRPCAGGAQQSAPQVSIPAVDPKERRAAELRAARDKATAEMIDARNAREQARRIADEQRQLSEYERTRQKNERGQEYGIAVGQSASDVRQTFGDPTHINFSADGSEQWVYYNNRSKIRYVYLRNGSVTSWQGTRTSP